MEKIYDFLFLDHGRPPSVSAVPYKTVVGQLGSDNQKMSPLDKQLSWRELQLMEKLPLDNRLFLLSYKILDFEITKQILIIFSF